MNLFTRYISTLYLKYFFILFISLEVFFVVIDLVKYLDELPNSANLIVLLLFYDFIYASQFILPLSLILAQIILFITMLKNSQWTAFLSLGYTKFKIFFPIFTLSFLITFIYILLNATPFAYAKEKVDLIIEAGYIGSYKSDLFVKYDNKYIHFSRIYPLLKSAEGISVYEFDLNDLIVTRIIKSKRAEFVQNHWQLSDVEITTLKKNAKLGENAVIIENEKSYSTLDGFKPKILDSIYEKQGSISILDAYDAILLLKSQGVPTNKIRASLYALLFFSLFAPLVMMILAYWSPNSNRYVNLAGLALSMILCVLVLWGIFFSFSRLSMSGFLQPEFSVILPITLLALVSFYFVVKIARE